MENKASPKCLLTFVPEELVEELENETIEVDLTLYEPDSHENSPAATYYKQTATGKKRGSYAPKETNPVSSGRSKRTRSQNVSTLSSSYGDDESISHANDSELDSPNDSTPSVNEILSDLGFSEEYITKTKKQIGSAENRATDTNLPSTNPNNVYNALKTTLVDCTAVVANVLFPADPEQLQKTAAEATLSNLEKSKKKEAKPPRATRKRLFDETRNKFTDFISNLTNSSIAKRAANALIQACLPDEGLEDLFVLYKAACEDQNKTPLGKTTFRELAGKITSGGQTKAISCVNYIDGNLVNDNCERLQMIVDTIFEKSSEKHKFYTEHISHMKNFLKTQFDSHLQKNDGDAFHSLTLALCKPCRHDTTKCDHRAHLCSVCINPEKKFECTGCNFSFLLLAELHDEVKRAPLQSSSSQVENDQNNSSEVSDNLESQP
ncbi:hypothetical protein CTEN210_05466 [Chaetoceros tenuissimus]|uniref:Uncharacterized protein n=1 Tax=Chaetoceros tenuissimus TaxID=426638 RepID=A0AAD3CQI8_9STRA|nr:hypothetical protein CTEN210_05466 [Chaetoceros tenuissimus]